MAQNAEESTEIPEVVTATDSVSEVDAATGGLLGPISGFIYDNALYTGTYVYPEFLDANVNIIFHGDSEGVFELGVAIGETKSVAVTDCYKKFPADLIWLLPKGR